MEVFESTKHFTKVDLHLEFIKSVILEMVEKLSAWGKLHEEAKMVFCCEGRVELDDESDDANENFLKDLLFFSVSERILRSLKICSSLRQSLTYCFLIILSANSRAENLLRTDYLREISFFTKKDIGSPALPNTLLESEIL
jgi:hypothetical protein